MVKKNEIKVLDSAFEAKFEDAKAFFKAKNFVIGDNELKGIMASLNKHYPILLIGGTGTGKTLFFQLLAEFLKGTYEYASLNGSITIHDLTQERILDKDGTFKENDMILARWLRLAQKEQSILQLDEVNAARPETLLAMHPIMDLKGELRLPFSNEVLKVTNNAILVMSCNEGDEYAGINAMNMAFQNRYIVVHFDYIQGDVLANMLTAKTSVTLEDTRKIVKVWEKYMSSRECDQPIVSIRVLERWCELSKLLGVRHAGIVTFGGLISKCKKDLDVLENSEFFVNLPN